MPVNEENKPGNQALKKFLAINKLETGEENAQYAERAKVAEQVLYRLISGKTKKATRLVAEAIINAAKGRCSVELTMRDMGYED